MVPLEGIESRSIYGVDSCSCIQFFQEWHTQIEADQ